MFHNQRDCYQVELSRQRVRGLDREGDPQRLADAAIGDQRCRRGRDECQQELVQ